MLFGGVAGTGPGDDDTTGAGPVVEMEALQDADDRAALEGMRPTRLDMLRERVLGPLLNDFRHGLPGGPPTEGLDNACGVKADGPFHEGQAVASFARGP